MTKFQAAIIALTAFASSGLETTARADGDYYEGADPHAVAKLSHAGDGRLGEHRGIFIFPTEGKNVEVSQVPNSGDYWHGANRPH